MGERIERISIWPPPDARWIVRVFGRIDISSQSGEKPHFRSKSVNSLFSYLVLHPGIEISRFFLEETFWPDSDCDKQAQNLRRAIADLRDALEIGIERGSLIQTKRDVVKLNSEMVASDAQRFIELIDYGLEKGHEDSLSELVTIYGGPLLSPLPEEWIYPHRLEYEELFAQSVSKLCQIKISIGAAKDSIRIGRAALLAAPNREDIHISLIHGYRIAGLEAEAIRQFEDLEKMMDEEWGEEPSAQAKDALEKNIFEISSNKTGRDRVILAESEPAGGAMAISSPFYIRRSADDYAEEYLDRGESIILIQGPRQVGKSSLLARMLDYGRSQGVETVFTDFQTIGESQLKDESFLYRALAHSFASQLKLNLDFHSAWNEWLGPNMNLDSMIGELLERTPGKVCWGIDEADALFSRAYAGDFYGLLRSWHNRRALDPTGPWSKLTLVLSYATEAHLFITDLNQSPFNVGLKVAVRDFTRSEVETLAARFEVVDRDDVLAVLDVANGHPFLTRRALAFLKQGSTPEELRSSAPLVDGPFGDHLHRILASVTYDPQILQEVKNVLAAQPISNPVNGYRLMSAGILATNSSAGTFRVPVYEHYLRAALG